MNKNIGFRATAAQREKLEALAAGEGVTITSILARLVDQVPVVPSKAVIKSTLRFSANQKSSAATFHGDGAASVGN